MSIITVSRGSYSRGKEIAEKVAARLGYECIAREAVIEASSQFNIPEVRLVRAVHDAPSVLDRFTSGKERYVAYVRAALLRHLHRDNVVYHGLAGQFFLRGISHVLKVRVLADMKDRVAFVRARDNVSEEFARLIIEKDDRERRKWSKHLYGIDTSDPNLYDLVLHIGHMTVEDAVDVVCNAVELEHFRTTPESQQELEDLLLASEVKAKLVDIRADISVCACDGIVVVNTVVPLLQEEILAKKMRESAEGMPGLKELRINAVPPPLMDSRSAKSRIAEDGARLELHEDESVVSKGSG